MDPRFGVGELDANFETGEVHPVVRELLDTEEFHAGDWITLARIVATDRDQTNGLLQGGVLQRLVKGMRAEMEHAEIQALGCRILAGLVLRNSESESLEVPSVQTAGNGNTSVHSQRQYLTSRCAGEALNAGGVSVVLTAMRRHFPNQDVQQGGCCALRSFTCTIECQRALAHCQGVIDVVRAIRLSDEYTLVEDGFEVLANLSGQDSFCSCAVRDAGGPTAVVEHMNRMGGCAQIQLAGCRLLSRMCSSEDLRHALLRAGVVRAIASVLTADGADSPLRRTCVDIFEALSKRQPAGRDRQLNPMPLSNLMAKPDCTDQSSDHWQCSVLVEGGAVLVLLRLCALARNSGEKEEHVHTLRVLANIIEYGKGAMRELSSAPQVVECVLAETEAYSARIANTTAASRVLSTVLQCSPACCKALVACGGHRVLVSAMQMHAQITPVQVAGCCCLESLAREPKLRRAVVEAGGAEVALTALRSHHVRLEQQSAFGAAHAVAALGLLASELASEAVLPGVVAFEDVAAAIAEAAAFSKAQRVHAAAAEGLNAVCRAVRAHKQRTARADAARRRQEGRDSGRSGGRGGERAGERARLRLQSLPPQVLGSMWPAERLLLGMRTSRGLRRDLAGCAAAALLEVPRSGFLCDGAAGGEQRVARQLCALRGAAMTVRCGSFGQGPRGEPGVCGLLRCLRAGAAACRAEGSPWRGLTRLELSGAGLREEDGRLLGEVVRGNARLEGLDVSRNALGGQGMRAVAGALAEGNVLRELDLGENRLCDDGSAAVGEALQHCSALEKLDLGGNALLAGRGFRSMVRSFLRCPALQSIGLRRTLIGLEGVGSLALVLPACTALTALDVRSNNFGLSGMELLAECLELCSNIRHVQLGGNANPGDAVLGSFGAAVMAGLRKSVHAEQMELSDSDVGGALCHQLATVLVTRSQLQHLELRGNPLGDSGVETLAAALRGCPALRLTRLGLARTKVGPRGVGGLVRALRALTAMRDLDLCDNALGDEGALALAELPWGANGRAWLRVGLSRTAMGDAGACALGRALERGVNSHGGALVLEQLDVQGNRIAGAGCTALAAAVLSGALLRLNVAASSVGPGPGVRALTELISARPHTVCDGVIHVGSLLGQKDSDSDSELLHRQLLAALQRCASPPLVVMEPHTLT